MGTFKWWPPCGAILEEPHLKPNPAPTLPYRDEKRNPSFPAAVTRRRRNREAARAGVRRHDHRINAPSGRGEARVQRLDQLINRVLRRVEHDARADDVAVEAALADEDAAPLRLLEDFEDGLRVRLFGLAVFDQFNGLHESHAAHVAYTSVLVFEFFEALAEVRADFGGVTPQVFVFDEFDDGQRRGHRDGVAAEGREGDARKLVRDFGSGDGDADGDAVAETFGGGDDVRLDVPVLDAEPLVASSAPGRLHLVGDEEAAVLARDLNGALEVAGGRDDEAADAEYGFGHEGRNLARRRSHNQFFDVFGAGQPAFGVAELEGAAVAVGSARVNNACDLRRQRPPRRMARGRKSRGRAPRIAVAQDDYLVAARGRLGRVDGRVVGLRAAVGEEGFFQLTRRDLIKLLGEVGLRLVGVERRGVLERLDLLDDRLGDFRVVVADAHGEHAAEAVEVLVALIVPDVLALAADERERLLVVHGDRGEKKFLVLLDGLGVSRIGLGRVQLRFCCAHQ